MSTDREGSPWRPTVAHGRATTATVLLIGIAVGARRPDMLVIALPFAVASVWATVSRPRSVPRWREAIGHAVLREGAATRWRATFEATESDLAVAEFTGREWVERSPSAGVVAIDGRDDEPRLEIGFQSTRWGRRRVGGFRVTGLSSWGAFRSVGPTTSYPIVTLPSPSAFDSVAPFRPADGLVGQYRSARSGEGGEFAAVRSFQPGDRMRRINWTRSLRSDELQVNATWSDEDSQVVLLLDASLEIGQPDDQRTSASSLDIGVRAAAAISEHLTRRGDRVSLHVYGGAHPRIVPPGTGRAHERRMLDLLAGVRSGEGRGAFRHLPNTMPGLAGASLVVMLSPLATSDAIERAAMLGRRGLSVVIIDCLPTDLADDPDPLTSLAWRIRVLERRREVRRIERVGVPVVQWRGPGSLDVFLRDVARRARAPRMRA